MFSVIIPLYNKVAYIGKAVDSVLKQTFTQFELIVIDDGSTDNGQQRLATIKDSRLTIISQQNTGVSVARNRGVTLAKYPWIAFLDADDWWHADFLNEFLSLVTNYPSAVLYGSNYFYVKHGQNRLEDKGLSPNFEAGYIDYLSIYATRFCVLINCSFVVVRKAAFDAAGGFKSALQMGEDIDLWIRLALMGPVAYVNKPLAYSNQDVEVVNRAIGGTRLYPPQAHVTFNLSFLEAAENNLPALKKLTDGLRVRSLLPYVLAGQHTEAVKQVLSEVDFGQQPIRYQLLYWMPSQLLSIYFQLKRMGATAKRLVYKHSHKPWSTVR